MDSSNRDQELRRQISEGINRNHKRGRQVKNASAPEKTTTTQSKTESNKAYGIHIPVRKIDECGRIRQNEQ